MELISYGLLMVAFILAILRFFLTEPPASRLTAGAVLCLVLYLALRLSG